MTVTIASPIEEIPRDLNIYSPRLLKGQTLTFSFLPSHTHAGQILTTISNCGLIVKDITTKEVDLEDIFVRLTAKSP